MIKKFLSDRSGAYALMLGLFCIPLLLAVGFGVDYSRGVRAKAHLQELADGASLAAAASNNDNSETLTDVAEDYIRGNYSPGQVDDIQIASITASKDSVNLTLSGTLQTYFMGLANINTLQVKANALAVRGVTGSVEVSLVLDNTWSMSETDAKGVTKIAALKAAATSLVNSLLTNNDAPVRIGLVPYGDYVNVGTGYRNASWLSVPADYSTSVPQTCSTVTQKTICDAYAPTATCTSVNDGVSSTYTCGGGCTASHTEAVTPYQSCSGGYTTSYSWYGCVGSRTVGDARLNDSMPSVTYPGYLATSQLCLNPIVPLTDDKTTILNGISSMIVNIGGYKPDTYIPAGLVWGLNELSPSEPLTQADAYDPNNVKPRKVVVLMTDGENTLYFNAPDGRHLPFSGSAAASQAQMTHDDTVSLCSNIKAKKIEVFTIAFSVDDSAAKDLLASCATDAQHYFDATDSDSLAAAFANIAQSLTNVRLAR